MFVISAMIVYFACSDATNMSKKSIAEEVATSTFANANERSKNNGQVGNEYRISTAEDLEYLSTHQSSYLSSSFVQLNNIEMNSSSWTPIGTSSSNTFTGNYNGNGFTITFRQKIVITQIENGSALEAIHAGLFGFISDAIIQNLNIDWTNGFEFVSNDFAYINADIGGIVARAENNSEIICCNTINKRNMIVNAKASGHSANNCTIIGGIVGYCSNIVMQQCFNSCNIEVKYSAEADYYEPEEIAYVGGIAGVARESKINSCYNIGKIDSQSQSYGSNFTGGIVGSLTDGTITNVFNQGEIIGIGKLSAFVGGIVGVSNFSSTEYLISNCYNIGNITATSQYANCYSGGIVGTTNTASAISNCIYYKDCVESTSNSYGDALTAEEMSDLSNYDGWSEDIWAVAFNQNKIGDTEYTAPILSSFYNLITYDSNDENNEKKVGAYEKTQATVTLETIENLNFTNESTFIKWQDEMLNEYTNGQANVSLTQNIVLKAQWQPKEIQITFNITSNVGAIINITDESGENVQQVYVKASGDAQDIQIELMSAVYKAVISTYYTSNITATVNSVQTSGNTVTFDTSSASAITIVINGFIGNNGIVI